MSGFKIGSLGPGTWWLSACSPMTSRRVYQQRAREGVHTVIVIANSVQSRHGTLPCATSRVLEPAPFRWLSKDWVGNEYPQDQAVRITD